MKELLAGEAVEVEVRNVIGGDAQAAMEVREGQNADKVIGAQTMQESFWLERLREDRGASDLAAGGGSRPLWRSTRSA